jgi:hypothetical protein
MNAHQSDPGCLVVPHDLLLSLVEGTIACPQTWLANCATSLTLVCGSWYRAEFCVDFTG